MTFALALALVAAFPAVAWVSSWWHRRRLARALSMAHASMIRESFGGRGR